MRKVHYIGSVGYHGMDYETRERIHALPGETIVVSDGKARQLLEDFPAEWKDRGPFTLRPAARAPNVTYPRSPKETT